MSRKCAVRPWLQLGEQDPVCEGRRTSCNSESYSRVALVQEVLGHALAVEDVLLDEVVGAQRIRDFRLGGNSCSGVKSESVACGCLDLEILDF